MLSRNRSTTRQIKLVLLAVLLCTGIGPILSPALHAQADPVAELMAGMTSAEKVGQLFVVAFWGRNPSPPSRAGQLIQQHKIGGVVLITSNNNLVNAQSPPEQTVADVSRLCNTLQGMALEEAGSGIPLFIAIDHEGDGYPYTRITNGTTPLPNPMAIGATWDTRYAEQVGEIAGRELSAMGINMLLGPVVDVLDAPRPGDKGDIGTRAFGGDPYWVGEMGRAYVRGVHVGSQGQILTVAKHFPGHGGSDRLPDDEIATVDKSLQELKRVELAPFFAVTTPQDPDGLDRTDAMMSSHIRYRGFYGDIRQFTRPISFDAESMQAILDLPEFREWREDGLMISDSLGVPAVRKYFDPQLQTFPHRQIAREAFLSGNDVLILSEFALISDWAQQYDNVVEVLAYFRETYDSDPAFAARVDESVARILRFKLQLYPDLSSEQVLVSPDEQAEIGQGAATVDQIARQATTVLQSTISSLPAPPRRDEDILIFAEDRMIQECFDTIPECAPHALVPPTALEEAILRLYGPEGTGQVDRQRIDTRTFGQLKTYLTQREGDVGMLLEEAEWIVFAMLDPNPRYPDSDALQLFLAQNAHQIYNAKVIGLAYTAPYYLDATEISKLTAYYVFYSKTLPFIEASARTLFGEVRPPGRSPVSIEGTYYDLGTQLAPDPDQQVVLERIEPAQDSAIVPCTVRVRTHTIHDRNGNPVPDGTPVQFVARDGESQQLVDTATALTVNGVAEADLSIDRPGRIVVVASSGDTGEGPPVSLQALAEPTPTPPPPTRTPTLTPQVTPTATARSTAAPTPTIESAPTFAPTPQPPSLGTALDAWQGQPRDLPGALGGMLLAAGVGYLWWGHKARRPYRIRPVLLAWIGGLLGYVLHGWGWVPVSAWTGWPAWLGSGIAACAGALILVIAARLGMRERPTESSGTAPAR